MHRYEATNQAKQNLNNKAEVKWSWKLNIYGHIGREFGWKRNLRVEQAEFMNFHTELHCWYRGGIKAKILSPSPLAAELQID